MPPVFLVLSEDGSHQVVPALTALTKKMCQLVVPTLKTHLLRFEPPEDRQRKALTANKWKSRSPADQFLRTDLLKYITTHLLRPDGFVIFHIDGDTPYSARSLCSSYAEFEDLILDPVSQFLRKGRTDQDAVVIARKLITFVPHYCVEAWTYYNLPVLEEICHARVDATNDEILARWKATPAEIEEAERPWSLVRAGKDHNRALAERAYPAQSAFDVGKSFTDTVIALLHNAPLVTALQELA